MGLVIPLSIWAAPEEEIASPVFSASPAGNLMERISDEAMLADSDVPRMEPAGEAELDPAYIQTADEFPEPIEGTTSDPQMEEQPPAVTPPLSAEQVAINTEMAYQQKLEDAEQEFMEASLEVNRIENEIGDLKDELKAARELSAAYALRLRAIRGRASDPDDEEDDEDDADEAEPYMDMPPPAGICGAANSSNASADPDSVWRDAELRPIITGTKGAGQKKLDAICDLCPTVGHFVDLQVQAGASGVNTLMPDGVGRGLCDVLEEKVLDFITSRQGGDFSKTLAEGTANLEARREELAGGRENQQDDAVGNEADAVGNQEDAPTAEPQADIAEPLPNNETHNAQLRRRLKAMRSQMAEFTAGFPLIYQDGKDAARNERPYTDCNWTAGPEQDSWLAGWLSVPQAN